MLRKYPRTHHLESSRLQPGDEDMHSVAFTQIRNRYLVVEEKLDGANAAISFTPDGTLRLQSRGHYLTGGPRERQFGPFKAWAAIIQHALFDRIGSRYIVYGEWMYAKHTVFYDALPHYFCEFDILDTASGDFLSTARRADLLAGLPISSVPVLHTGPIASLSALLSFVGPSTCRTAGWRDALTHAAQGSATVVGETDMNEDMEGLYIKVEENGVVAERYKWVRPTFLTAVLDSGSHWADRPIVPNQLANPAVMYGGV
ncbi:DNA ligase [Kibdelosporangium aridum]|uniref:DNA ligase n=1 Tax=Kibdelosporangium aridum TaxID=2030 RepID=A0A428YRJ3_KIBAR|nr:RNA ligase family protein [Kibdelosporangium aridum]RSM71608.1 DNA ligase [Kibdelosporangium aridum]